MSRAEWELVEMARARALADRYEREALEAAVAHGCVGVGAQQAWALGWLAMRCADRQVRLEAERGRPLHAIRKEPQTHCECTHPLPYAKDAGRCFKCGWALRGHKAEQQHGTAVPAKDAARAQAAGPATPTPPRPQGVAGHPTIEWVDEADNDWGGHPPARESRK